MAEETLDSIISTAVAETPAKLAEAGPLHVEPPKDEKVKTEPKVEAPDEEEEEETPKEETPDEVDEYGLTKQEQLEARQLLSALKDKDRSIKVIDLLARENGYTKGEVTKTEEKKIVKGMVDDLKEALGPELEYLAEKMGPVFEKHLKAKTEESIKPLQDKVDQDTIERESKKAQISVDELGKTYFDGKIPDSLVADMSKIMDRVKPSGGQSIESYMKEVLGMAAINQGVELKATSKSKAEKILKNRNDAPSRLASEGSRSPKVGEKAANPRQQMTLEESIAQAMESSKVALTQ